MVGVITAGMALLQKGICQHAAAPRTVLFSAPEPAACHCRPVPPPETPGRKAEHRRTDAFELQCWRRLFRVPRTARSNQSILKEVNPEYSLEGLMLMLKLKLQYFGHLM